MSISNNFTSMLPNFKESYSDSKPRFQKIKKMMKSKSKATAELDASKDPMKALKDKSYLNLKGKKGIAV